MKQWLTGITAVLLLILSGCTPAQEPVVTSFFAMNTYMTFTAYGENAQDALDNTVGLVKDLEARWSVTDMGSAIYAANHSHGNPVQVSDETAALLSFALSMAEKTGGALEPTIYPVLAAWGFTTGSKQVPSQERLDALLTC